MNHSSGQTAGLVQLQPIIRPSREVGFGLVGIVIFTGFGIGAYHVSQELEGFAWFAALAFSAVCFLLAAAALGGTVYGMLASRIPAPVIELETLELVRGAQINGRLLQKGPATFSSLKILLVCTQTEFEEATRESLRSALDETDGERERETVTIERGEERLSEIELLRLEGLQVHRFDEVDQPFTVNIPADAVPSGVVPVSEFVSHAHTWRIVLHGDVPFWPDSRQEYEVSLA